MLLRTSTGQFVRENPDRGLTDQIGIGGGLMVSAALRLVGFGLFAWKGKISLMRPPIPAVKVQFKTGGPQDG